MAHVISKHPLTVGAGLALITLPIHALLPEPRSVELAALVMAIIAGVYIGFAVRADRAGLVWFEGGAALVFTAIAFAGLWGTKWLIPAVYVAHAGWDLLHRQHHGLSRILPGWYVPLCLVVDVVAGGGLVLIWLIM